MLKSTKAITIYKQGWKAYPVILFTEVWDVNISKDSRLGHENAMQASIVASISL